MSVFYVQKLRQNIALFNNIKSQKREDPTFKLYVLKTDAEFLDFP